MSKKNDYKKTAQKNKAEKNAASQKNSIREAKIAELEAASGKKKYKNPATSGWGKAIIVILTLLMAFSGLLSLILMGCSK